LATHELLLRREWSECCQSSSRLLSRYQRQRGRPSLSRLEERGLAGNSCLETICFGVKSRHWAISGHLGHWPRTMLNLRVGALSLMWADNFWMRRTTFHM
jgi:hypothetical protein